MARGVLQLSGNGQRKLAMLQRRLVDIASVKEAISESQAEEGIKLIRAGFDRETNPYGRPWAKRKRETRETRGKKVLSGKGPLKNSYAVKRADASGWRVSSDKEYALYHQKPRKGRRPQRMQVPDEGKGFPSTWRKVMNEVAEEVITDYLDL